STTLKLNKLLAVAISSITYLRGLFPERAYGTKYVEGNTISIVLSYHGLCLIFHFKKFFLMLGCYDALEKSIYESIHLILVIWLDFYKTFVILHLAYFYIFHRSFENTEARVTSADTKKACILLIRKLYVLMQNLGPLPSEISLTMKLFYYDEVTPQDYQPPGFKEGENDDMVFEGIPVQLMVGDVSTPFHTVKLKITTESNRLENVMHSDLNTNESKHMMEPDKEEEFSTQDSNISIRQVR
uniref:HORMA domain containing 1 n=1 Tax=Erpetoichthys calabaricus TaxID=27687 RepID=A0A8C4RIB1_ERPCA